MVGGTLQLPLSIEMQWHRANDDGMGVLRGNARAPPKPMVRAQQHGTDTESVVRLEELVCVVGAVCVGRGE